MPIFPRLKTSDLEIGASTQLRLKIGFFKNSYLPNESNKRVMKISPPLENTLHYSSSSFFWNGKYRFHIGLKSLSQQKEKIAQQ